jgi:hypothetical protein
MAATPEVGTPVRRGAGWWVPSGEMGYYIERTNGRWCCCCPSFRWRNPGTCKYTHAVRAMLKE